MVNMSAKEFLKLRTTTSFILTIPFFPNVSLCSQISKSFMCKQTTSPISLNLVDVRIKGCYTELQQLCPIFQTADEELTWDQEVWEGKVTALPAVGNASLKALFGAAAAVLRASRFPFLMPTHEVRGGRGERESEWESEEKKRPYGRRETDVQWNGGSPPSTRDSPWGIAQLGWQVCVIIVIAWLLLHTAYATFFW